MFRTSCLAFIVFTAAGWSASNSAPGPTVSQARSVLARQPLRFERNQGQWPSGVRYAARAGNLAVALEDCGASLKLGHGRHVDISLLHSSAKLRIQPESPLATRTDYYIGNRANWHTGVATFAKVRYDGVYPGIDIVYYGNQNQLEYDFVLAPGADPRAVRLKFSGADKLRITPEGDLAIETADGTLLQKKPAVYQQDPATGARTGIAGGYVLLGHNTAGLRLAGYDRARTLVVDPLIDYATYLGGTGRDQVVAVQTDNQGRLYVCGMTGTSDLVATANAYDLVNSGENDVFVEVIDTTPAGAYGILYFSYVGGTLEDVPTAMVVDSNQNVYITGSTTSTDYPIVGAAIQTTGAATNSTPFVSRLNYLATPSLQYSTYLGGTDGNQTGNGIAYDNNGYIYVIGTTQADDFPVTANAYQNVRYGLQDMFLAEFDPGRGTLFYASYLGGELEDSGAGILVDSKGLVYFTGSSISTLFPQAANQYAPLSSGSYDVVFGVMDFTQTGVNSLIYSTYLGGSSIDMARGMAFDNQGNVVITGYTLSPDFPVTPDAMQPTYAGSGDAFVSVVNYTNPQFLLYSTYLGGSDGDVGYGIVVDSAGSFYVTGYTLSSDFPTTSNAVQPAWGQGLDIFVTKFEPYTPGPSAVDWSTYIGSSSVNNAYGLAVGSDGRVYVGGYTGGEFPVTGNATQPTFGGGYTDGFVLVFTQ